MQGMNAGNEWREFHLLEESIPQPHHSTADYFTGEYLTGEYLTG